MLRKFRARHIKTIFWILLVVVVPSFVLWGVSSFVRNKKQNVVITVSGKPLSYTGFKEYLSMASIYYRLTMGESFYTKINQQLLEAKAFELILLLNKARKDKIKTGNKEIIKTVESIFSVDGKFNNALYERYTKERLMMTRRMFEECIRNILTADKVLDKYVRNISVKDSEVRKAYEIDNEKAELSYIYIPYSTLDKEINPVRNKAHEKSVLPSAKVSNEVDITDEDITAYYNKHKDEFRKEPKMKIKYILLDKNNDKNIIDAMVRHPEDTKDINAIIKRFSLKAYTTGYFDKQHPPKNIEWDRKVNDLALSMPLNKLSPLIEENRNYILFEKIAEDKNTTLGLNQIKDRIKQKLKNNKERIQAQKEGKAILKSLLSGKSKKLPYLAKKYELTNNDTEYLTRHEITREMGLNKDITYAIFKLKRGDIYNHLVTTDKGFYIVELKGLRLIDENKFKKAKESYRRRIITQRIFIRRLNFLSKLEKETPIKKLK